MTPITKSLALGALVALALPTAASARGGGETVPDPGATGPACASVVPSKSVILDKLASGKPILIDLKVTNCSARVETVDTTLVPTARTVVSTDPYVVQECTGATITAAQLTLRPGESRVVTVGGGYPSCGYNPWGIGGYDIDHAVSVREAGGDGTVLGTTLVTVQRRGGV